MEGSGSLSDWMGKAGALSREAAPVCSHAQLSTHSKERSARGTSIPKLPLCQSLHRIVPSDLRYPTLYEATVVLERQISKLRGKKKFHSYIQVSAVICWKVPSFKSFKFQSEVSSSSVSFSSAPTASSESRPFLLYSLLS